MILLQLFWEFLKIGMFAFGGAYGAIPLIRESVLNMGWASEEMFANIVALSESTPGPIMLNTATYIGKVQVGLPGAVVATLGVVLPSFVIVLLVTRLLNRFLRLPGVQVVLRGVKPCLMGVILATDLLMATESIFPSATRCADGAQLAVFLLLALLPIIWKRIRGKEFQPILLIFVSALLGICIL